jgi:hypothetical protein
MNYETAPRTPEMAAHHPEWDMDAEPGGIEDLKMIRDRLAAKIRIWDETNQHDAPANAMRYTYRPDQIADAQGDLGKSMAWQYMGEHSADFHKNWWMKLRSIRDNFQDDIFQSAEPTEQLIIGEEDQGTRFYNFGEPMTKRQRIVCRDFIDRTQQYLGDKTHELLTDVVFTNFTENSSNRINSGTDGFVHPELPGVMFINAELLAKERSGEAGYDLGRIFATMLHEKGHVYEGDLEEYARATGWDVDRMNAEQPDWRHQPGDQESYKPTDFMRSKLSEQSPQESHAEAGMYAMMGDEVLNGLMPETRDAWLEHLLKRLEKDSIIVPIDRPPLKMDYRRGDDILYPRTRLPETVNVVAVSLENGLEARRSS